MTGKELVRDEKTGYLEPTGSRLHSGFTGKRKATFIRLAKQGMWPNVSKICEKIGITRFTFANHLQVDPLFREHVELLKESMCDNIEADMVGYAKDPKGFMDRIALLRAHRKEIYDPKKIVTIEHRREADPKAAESRLTAARDYVDAELVQPAEPQQINPPENPPA